MSTSVAAGEHGGDAVWVARSLGVDPASLLDLSMSMNPFAPDVRPIVAAHVDEVSRYPHPGATDTAEHRLAEAIGVAPERLVITNGGAAAIALVAALQPAGRVVDPDFSLYRRHLRMAEVGEEVPRWRSNPSNPLGELSRSPGAQPGDAAALGPVYDVWDEAFHPLATGRWSDPNLADAPVWRLGSLTKTWSCPGLRLGYAIAPDERGAAELRRIRPAWSVNGLALAVVEPMLALTDLEAWANDIASARADLARALRHVGVEATETQANWLLVRDGRDLRSLLAAESVVVRDCANFGLPSMFRVAVPRPDDIDRVVDAFVAIGEEQA